MSEEKCYPCKTCVEYLAQQWECMKCKCRDCRRFEAAMAAMTGFIIQANYSDNEEDKIAVLAKKHADALLSELEKKE